MLTNKAQRNGELHLPLNPRWMALFPYILSDFSCTNIISSYCMTNLFILFIHPGQKAYALRKKSVRVKADWAYFGLFLSLSLPFLYFLSPFLHQLLCMDPWDWGEPRVHWTQVEWTKKSKWMKESADACYASCSKGKPLARNRPPSSPETLKDINCGSRVHPIFGALVVTSSLPF